MKIKFLGANQQVTGSCSLLETETARVLVDCGLYQEREYQARNWDPFPVPAKQIDFVILTHVHLDHSGLVPKLVKEGFSGRILTTSASREMLEIVLLDSGKIQEEDAAYKKKRHAKEKRKGRYPEIPLYTVEDAEKAESGAKASYLKAKKAVDEYSSSDRAELLKEISNLNNQLFEMENKHEEAVNSAMREWRKHDRNLEEINHGIKESEGIVLKKKSERDKLLAEYKSIKAQTFENLKEKTKAIGNLKGFHIIGKNGKLTLSKIKDMYLVLTTSENVDKTHIHSITHVIIPTILKTLETFAPTHLQFISQKN